MPRVHPRCGTNLFAGLTIFTSIAFGPFPAADGLRVLIAAMVTLVFWRPVGNMLQWLVTTKPPTKKQIEMGIKSGNELLEKYRLRRSSTCIGCSRPAASALTRYNACSLDTIYRVLMVVAVIVALLFSLLIFVTGKGDAMSGSGGVRTTFKGKASFEDKMSQLTLYLGIGFMALMMVLDIFGAYIARHTAS